MTDHRAPQAGAADPPLSAPRSGIADAQQAQQAGPARTPRAPAPRAPGYAAFGTGAGAAVVFRDLASI